MKLIGLVLRGARYKDEILEVGDLAIHDEEAFPEDAFASRTGGAFALAGSDESGGVGSSSPLKSPRFLSERSSNNEADRGSAQALQAR